MSRMLVDSEITPGTSQNELVTNSTMDASAPSFSPSNHAQYASPPQAPNHSNIYVNFPPDYTQYGMGPEAFPHHTNTTVPPPSIAFDGHTIPYGTHGYVPSHHLMSGQIFYQTPHIMQEGPPREQNIEIESNRRGSIPIQRVGHAYNPIPNGHPVNRMAMYYNLMPHPPNSAHITEEMRHGRSVRMSGSMDTFPTDNRYRNPPRPRAPLNASPVRHSRRHDPNRNSSSSDRNSHGNNYNEVVNEPHELYQHPEFPMSHYYHPAAYATHNSMVQKLEGPPLIMSGPVVYTSVDQNSNIPTNRYWSMVNPNHQPESIVTQAPLPYNNNPIMPTIPVTAESYGQSSNVIITEVPAVVNGAMELQSEISADNVHIDVENIESCVEPVDAPEENTEPNSIEEQVPSVESLSNVEAIVPVAVKSNYEDDSGCDIPPSESSPSSKCSEYTFGDITTSELNKYFEMEALDSGVCPAVQYVGHAVQVKPIFSTEYAFSNLTISDSCVSFGQFNEDFFNEFIKVEATKDCSVNDQNKKSEKSIGKLVSQDDQIVSVPQANRHATVVAPVKNDIINTQTEKNLEVKKVPVTFEAKAKASNSQSKTKSLATTVTNRLPTAEVQSPSQTNEAAKNTKIDKTPSTDIKQQTFKKQQKYSATSSKKVEKPKKSVPVPAPVSVWSKTKAWSEDFPCPEKKSAPTPSTQINGVYPSNGFDTCLEDGRKIDSKVDPEKVQVGEILHEYKMKYQSTFLQPRGLTNRSVWCYANSVLQSLLGIPQFVNLYRNLDHRMCVNLESMPVTSSLINFINKFEPMGETNLNTERSKRNSAHHLPEVTIDESFECTSIQKMLQQKKGTSFTSTQQDAEEFLSLLLNECHDELVECIKVKSSNENATPALINCVDDAEWHTQGPKKKACITRTQDFCHSPVSKIFWGETRSILKNGSTLAANIEPFVTLQLDIAGDEIHSVSDALKHYFGKGDLDDYKTKDISTTVSKEHLLEQLPEVLLLQLKYFKYNNNGSLKILKHIDVPITLEISKTLVTQDTRKKMTAVDKLKYKLVSIVYHDGKDANKGHYVSSVYHAGINCWLQFDDACVKSISANELQKEVGHRQPYILFYRRDDTFQDFNVPTNAYGIPKKRVQVLDPKKATSPEPSKVSPSTNDNKSEKPKQVNEKKVNGVNLMKKDDLPKGTTANVKKNRNRN